MCKRTALKSPSSKYLKQKVNAQILLDYLFDLRHKIEVYSIKFSAHTMLFVYKRCHFTIYQQSRTIMALHMRSYICFYFYKRLRDAKNLDKMLH